MSHSFRQTHFRLVAPRPAPQRREPSLAGPLLLLVMLVGGYFALAEDPKSELRALWTKIGTLAGTSPQTAPPATTRPLATPVFAVCGFGPRRNCVVDGDTFYFGDEIIRIADIDAPETHPPRCAREAELGARATQRLKDILNAGPVSLGLYERDTDMHGRKLRIVQRDGRSVGRMLVSEGLARPWTGRRQPWCG